MAAVQRFETVLTLQLEQPGSERLQQAAAEAICGFLQARMCLMPKLRYCGPQSKGLTSYKPAFFQQDGLKGNRAVSNTIWDVVTAAAR